MAIQTEQLDNVKQMRETRWPMLGLQVLPYFMVLLSLPALGGLGGCGSRPQGAIAPPPVAQMPVPAAAVPATPKPEVAAERTVQEASTVPVQYTVPWASVPVALVQVSASKRQASLKVKRGDSQTAERFSTMHPGDTFDPQTFARDPAAYLSVIEPGRALVDGPPGSPALTLDPLPAGQIHPGGQVRLVVHAQPLAPVSWFSANGGVFAESATNALTIQANADGLASVTWMANPGTEAAAGVNVASPLSSGLHFIPLYVLPE
jgi:hypothetical protein